MAERSKFGRLSIAVFEVRNRQQVPHAPVRPWPEAVPDDRLNGDASADKRDSTWMSADEVIDELMLDFDDEEFWQVHLPASTLRH